MTPTRLLDTRLGAGTPISGGTSRTLTVVGGAVPAAATAAVVLNVTAVDPIAHGFLTVFPTGSPHTRLATIVAPGGTVDVPVVATLTPPSGLYVSAVVMNVTATESTAPGFVTAHPGATPRPVASNLNHERSGQTIADHVTVGIRDITIIGLPSSGTVTLYSLSGIHLVADINGWYLQAINALS